MKSMLSWIFVITTAVLYSGCSDTAPQPPPFAADKAITAFGFTNPNAAGAIDQGAKAITVTVPFGADVTALVATFITAGVKVEVGTTAQVSGITKNDFTKPVVYKVTATDGSTATYTVTVTVAPSSAKAITTFSFASPSATGTIDGSKKTIAVIVPFGTDVTALVATFTTTGAKVEVGAKAQMSGATKNDFTKPVLYKVTAADSSTAAYAVTVTVAPSAAEAITAFSFASPPATGTIDGSKKTIAVIVPFGTDVTALVATFTTTGVKVEVDATAQVSGTTKNDFTKPVVYKVTAADGSTATYTVTVTVAPSAAKAIIAFSFASPPAIGTIDDSKKAIALTVPAKTKVTALVATFTTTGATVEVGSTVQVSGTSPNDFTSPVPYRVTAADGSSTTYTVTVTIAPPRSDKAITTFSFANPAATGIIDENATNKTIAVTVPFGTDVTRLVATFNASPGSTVTVGAVAQVSGMTPNDFTKPVVYTVTAEDSSTAQYAVTITVAKSSAKAITAFSIVKPAAGALIEEDQKTIVVNVPLETDVTKLVAMFTASPGATVAVNSVTQVSGTTPNDFTGPVFYTVTAADGSMTTYTVIVEVATGAIIDFSLSDEAKTFRATGVIDQTPLVDKTISVTVPFGTRLTRLIATFTASPGSTVTVGSVTQDSGETSNDFTNPVIYTVTPFLGVSTSYVVSVRM